MLTNREKFITSAVCPSVNNFLEDGILTSKSEIKKINAKARGKYFDMQEVLGVEEFFACSPTGKKAYFEYDFCHPCDDKTLARWKATAKRSAKLHAKGQYALAQDVKKSNWQDYDNFIKYEWHNV